MNSLESSTQNRTFRPLVTYFAIAYGITWLVFSPVALGQNGLGWLSYQLPDPAVLILFILGAYGPLVAAIITTRMAGGRVRDIFKRVLQWRVGVLWYLAALFAPLVVWLAGYSIAMNGLPLRLLADNAGMAAGLFFPNIVAGLFIPSLGEEPGWRGFALPRLEARFHPVLATLILGGLHSLWHLPALTVPGLLGPLTLENFATFMLTGTAATFLYVWVYNHSRGSVLTAIIMHAASNAASSLLTNLFLNNEVPLDALPIPYQWLNVMAFGTAALILVIATRGRMSYQGDPIHTASAEEFAPAATG